MAKKKPFPFAKKLSPMPEMTMDEAVLKGKKMPNKGLKGYKK